MSGLFGPRVRLELQRVVSTRRSGQTLGEPVQTWGPLPRTSDRGARVRLPTSEGALRVTLLDPGDANGNDYTLSVVTFATTQVAVDDDAATVTLARAAGATAAQVQAVLDADPALSSAYEDGEDGTGSVPTAASLEFAGGRTARPTEVWAQLLQHRGRDELAADEVRQFATRTWRLVRRERELTTKDRIVEGGRVWWIHDLRPVPARKGARRSVTQITVGTERLP